MVSGEPLENARVSWDLVALMSPYSPPGWSSYIFGRNDLHWWKEVKPCMTIGHWNFSGKTNKQGKHDLELELGGNKDYSPCQITLNLTAGVRGKKKIILKNKNF